jgi:inorganic pyrophosphatase/exopolyphosphatase
MTNFMRKIILFDEAEDAIEEAVFSADQENIPYAIITLADLERVTQEFAQAEAERQYLMEFRKSKKAILMAEAERSEHSMPIAKQERYAYSHPEYLELLEGLKVAIEKAVLLRHKIQVMNMRFEQWRSKQATLRQEMSIR